MKNSISVSVIYQLIKNATRRRYFPIFCAL